MWLFDVPCCEPQVDCIVRCGQIMPTRGSAAHLTIVHHCCHCPSDMHTTNTRVFDSLVTV